MVINELELGKTWSPLQQQKLGGKNTIYERNDKFVDTLNELITDTNELQLEASDARDKFIKGEPIDVHDVMIAAEKAKTSFDLLMELRNKGLDLYRETLRMQV